MDITIKGAKGFYVPADLKWYTIDAVKKFSRALNINRKRIDLHINFYNSSLVDSCFYGFCTPETTREFEIDIALLGNWVMTLAHEMVHVKQFAKGELSIDMDRWKRNRRVGKLKYTDQPWEREAFRMQHNLVKFLEKSG